jgi:hypothetical protein
MAPQQAIQNDAITKTVKYFLISLAEYYITKKAHNKYKNCFFNYRVQTYIYAIRQKKLYYFYKTPSFDAPVAIFVHWLGIGNGCGIGCGGGIHKAIIMDTNICNKYD